MAAVKAVEKHAFDIIFIEMKLPVMNGRETIKKIRSKGYQGPVVAMISEDSLHEAEISRNAGCCETLGIPIDRKKLLACLHDHLVGTKPAQSSVPSVTKYRGRVLLAEDTPDNQRLIQLMFEKWGVTLTVVEDGKQAVEAALANDYDLILMDMQMPVMGGAEATQKLIEAGCKTPIVALTANALKHDREHYEAIGCVGFVAKPINRDAFEKVLAKFLHQEQMVTTNAFKIVRRNVLPEEDKVIPDNKEVHNQFRESVMNSLQLTAMSVPDAAPGSAPESGVSDESSVNLSDQQQLNDALRQLAQVLQQPLVKQFMRQVLDADSSLDKVGAPKINGEAQPLLHSGTNGNAPIFSTVLESDPDFPTTCTRPWAYRLIRP